MSSLWIHIIFFIHFFRCLFWKKNAVIQCKINFLLPARGNLFNPETSKLQLNCQYPNRIVERTSFCVNFGKRKNGLNFEFQIFSSCEQQSDWRLIHNSNTMFSCKYWLYYVFYLVCFEFSKIWFLIYKAAMSQHMIALVELFAQPLKPTSCVQLKFSRRPSLLTSSSLFYIKLFFGFAHHVYAIHNW